MIHKYATPVFRWAGGKRWFLKYIENYLPKKFTNYHEPFLGGGAIFFELANRNLISKASLNDSNKDLINSYKAIKNNLDDVIKNLKTFKNTEAFYYSIRERNRGLEVINPADFIYLNRTSFNGLYRVNLKGEFNVPYGHKKYNELFDYDNLSLASALLAKCTLSSTDFSTSIENIEKNDLVFIDPPYVNSSNTNGFVKYNEKIFSWEDQVRLKNYIKKIQEIGAYFILTNANHSSIIDLYSGLGSIDVLKRSSVISGSKGGRGNTKEIVIFNTIN